MEAILKNPALKLKLGAHRQSSAARGETDAEEPRIRLQLKGEPPGSDRAAHGLQAQTPQQCLLLAVLSAGVAVPTCGGELELAVSFGGLREGASP